MSDTTNEARDAAAHANRSPAGAARRAALAASGKQALDNLVSRSKHAMESLTGRNKHGAETGKDGSSPNMDRFQQTMREPTTGAAVAGAAVAGAIGLFGVTPALLGATTGYVVYRSLRKRNDQTES